MRSTRLPHRPFLRFALAAVVLMVIAVPAAGAAPSGPVGAMESWNVSGSFFTDSGYVGLSVFWAENTSAYGPPYWYVMGNDWMCSDWDGGLMPTVRFVGKDRVTVDGTFASADLDCSENSPSTITFSLEFDAAVVFLQEDRGRITVIKGMDPYLPESTHTLTWTGEYASITGVLNGESAIHTNWGGFWMRSDLPT